MPATASQRKKTGMKNGAYPVSTKSQALSAIKLRHNNKQGISAASVLNHVARSKWGSDPEVKAKIKTAREKDKK